MKGCYLARSDDSDFALYNDCCLNAPFLMGDQRADFILADMPYGTTQNKWDSVIDFKKMWAMIDLVSKPDTAIALMAQTPFDKVLGSSNLKFLKYEWIWEKPSATGFLNAKKMPLKAHENILIFYKKAPTYNPQKTTGHKPTNTYTKHSSDGTNYGKTKIGFSGGGNTDRYPRSVIVFSSDKQKTALHPTQKPVLLMEYFIKTYSNPGELVLDFTMGSGTTGIAAMNLGRSFIGIERDEAIFKIAESRLLDHRGKLLTAG